MTPRAKDALALIATLQRQAGPSVREVARLMEVAPNAAQRLVSQLREEGALAPDSGDGCVLFDLQKVGRPNTKPAVRVVQLNTKTPEKVRARVQPTTSRDRAPLFKPNGRL